MKYLILTFLILTTQVAYTSHTFFDENKGEKNGRQTINFSLLPEDDRMTQDEIDTGFEKQFAQRPYLRAELDLIDANEFFQKGVQHTTGKGSILSYEKALENYLKAAKMGHANAQYNLGLFYEKGVGCQKSYKEADFWYDQASKYWLKKMTEKENEIDEQAKEKVVEINQKRQQLLIKSQLQSKSEENCHIF